MYVAIMGYGTVGSGVAALLRKNHELIRKKSLQETLELKYILDLRTFPGDENESLVINDFSRILGDDGVKIVVETMGGLHPAYDFVSACLAAGKSVVTSNKELVAAKGKELLSIAAANNANFLFEASVGGGIPVLTPIIQCLAANEISEVAGILNGTTNYILTKMFDEGADFESTLVNAQQLGYAERDPSADVDGIDACRKICILADLCFGLEVKPDSFTVEGIRKITETDVGYAKALGGVIKLIASAEKLDGGKRVAAYVSPAFIGSGSQLANVSDVYNAVLVRGDATGDTVFYGKGAGKMPTASAVMADVIDCAVNFGKTKAFGWSDAPENYVISDDEFTSAFIVRAVCGEDKVKAAFGDVRTVTFDGAPSDTTAFVTGVISKASLKKSLADLGEIRSVIRVTDY